MLEIRGQPSLIGLISNILMVSMISFSKWLKGNRAFLSFFGAFSGSMLLALTPAFSQAGTPRDLPSDLTRLTLEELMDIQVTSVSKGEEDFFKAASAIFVITQEDLRRSGVNTIPKALRLARIVCSNNR